MMASLKILLLGLSLVLSSLASTVLAKGTWYPPPLPDTGGLASTAVIERGVVKVFAKWYSGDSEIGTGILLDVDGAHNLFILTAAHVVRQFGSADQLSIQFHGDPVNRSAAELFRYDDNTDLAVLLVRGFYRDDVLKSLIKYPLAPAYDYALSGSIKTIGHPGDSEWLITSGRSVPIADETKMGLEADVVEYGNSGGPVLTSDNRLIGMVTEKLEGQDIAYAVRVDFILKQLDDWNVPIRARFVGDIAGPLANITHAIWRGEWERIKGRPVPHDFPYYEIWEPRETLLERGRARIVLWLNKIMYIEHLGGEYAAGASLDEAWRIWLNKIVSSLQAKLDKRQTKWKVAEPGRYEIIFETKVRPYGWVRIKVLQKNNHLYVIMYESEHPFEDLTSPQPFSDFFFNPRYGGK